MFIIIIDLILMPHVPKCITKNGPQIPENANKVDLNQFQNMLAAEISSCMSNLVILILILVFTQLILLIRVVNIRHWSTFDIGRHSAIANIWQ